MSTTPAITESSLAGTSIVVTGATGGIGRCLLTALVAGGASIAATGSDQDKLDDLSAELPTVATLAADITNEAAVERFYDFANARLGPLDVVVNLAGLSIPGKIADTEPSTFHKVMAVNVLGTFLSCKYALSVLAHDGGLIVNVGSLAGRRPNASAPLYCTAKAAVAMFSDALALQVKERNVRVTNLTPGGTDTPFWGDRKVDRTRLMSAQDVVDTLLFVITRPRHVVIHDLQFESFATN